MPLILNGSTGISGTDGSAGTPAVQGTDNNTGMFFPAADQIAFAEGGTEVMRLDASGNVGIGTSSPAAKFDTTGTGTTEMRVRSQTSGDARVGFWAEGAAYNYIQTVRSNGALGTFADLTTFNNASGTERARINSNGDWMVGTTSRLDQATNASGLSYVAGDYLAIATTVAGHSPIIVNKTNSQAGNCILFRYNGTTQTGAITNTSTTTTYSTSSDYRLKENVAPLTGAAARVQALKPSRFNFIADPARTVDGFIAHEAAEVVPEAVHGEKDAVDAEGRIQPQGIDHSKLVPLLTAALQEALTEIAALKARVAALEAR